LLSILIIAYILYANRGYYLQGVSFIDYIKWSSNIVPFRTISLYTEALFSGSMNTEIPVGNLFGNSRMFLPMGIYLPCIFRRTRKFLSFLLCMTGILLLLEAGQLLLRTGSFDIDDLILNLAGASLGYAIWKIKQVRKVCSIIFEAETDKNKEAGTGI
jgi:glycopeptide antibiotics resistance protein